MAIRVSYKDVERSVRGEGTPRSNSENNANFDGRGEGVPPGHDTLTLGLDAWIWATQIAHQDAQAAQGVEAFRFFFLWNSTLEGL